MLVHVSAVSSGTRIVAPGTSAQGCFVLAAVLPSAGFGTQCPKHCRAAVYACAVLCCGELICSEVVWAVLRLCAYRKFLLPPAAAAPHQTAQQDMGKIRSGRGGTSSERHNRSPGSMQHRCCCGPAGVSVCQGVFGDAAAVPVSWSAGATAGAACASLDSTGLMLVPHHFWCCLWGCEQKTCRLSRYPPTALTPQFGWKMGKLRLSMTL